MTPGAIYLPGGHRWTEEPDAGAALTLFVCEDCGAEFEHDCIDGGATFEPGDGSCDR